MRLLRERLARGARSRPWPGAPIGAVGLASLAMMGCGGPRQATVFTGFSRPPIVDAATIRNVDAIPTGYDDLGTLIVECHAPSSVHDIRGEYLADVDCSTGRLLGALRERAAAVGGELLVGTWCDGDVVAGGLRSGHCESGVARPSSDEPASPLLRPAVLTQEATMAWRIQVTYSPQDPPARPPRPLSAVQERAEMPANHRVLGEVSASCVEGCSEQAVADGLLAVAGRLGGSAVVGVSCGSKERGFECRGAITDYLVDPRADAAAR